MQPRHAARILVVDDEQGIRDLLGKELAALGHNVDTAGDGEEALQKMERGKFQVALCDLNMPKQDGMQTLEAIRQRDPEIEVIMMTGDSKPVADAVARQVGVDTVLAEVSPEQKAAKVKELRSSGKRVGMVGDGVNDAPALLTADVGIAIGAGTDVAVEAGDVVLIRSDPGDVPRIIALSKATYRKMIQNLWWAAGYNIVAIPLAAGILASRGIVLSPAIGAVLMSASTVIVALNAQLLRRVKLYRQPKVANAIDV